MYLAEMAARVEVEGSVLRVVDASMAIAVPFLFASVVIGHVSSALIWLGVGVGTLGLLAILRRRAPTWRGAGYAFVAIIVSNLGLWLIGPITGVGVALAMAILFAGAFLSRRWLIGCLAISITSITIRVLVTDPATPAYPVSFSLWMATALSVAAFSWLGMRALKELLVSLERSYSEAATALELEVATRAQLEASRAELEELAQVEMVGRLAGGVAHDVNNALASIIAAAEILADEVSTPSQRRDLAELEAASLYAGDLVRDLLWTGRRFTSTTKEVAALGSVVRTCRERVGRVARAVEIATAIDPSLLLAMAPEHLEQILFGLIVWLDRSGATRLEIAIASDERWVEISIAAQIDQTTEPARAVQARLGVPASRELVASYGGEQRVSYDPSRIAIELRLPLSADAAAHSLRELQPIRTALVVEDEPMVLRRLCKLATQRGYDVQAASTVADALVLLETHPDLLITDMQLPDGSGREIALAAFAQNPRRPIIVCSGFTAENVRGGVLQNAPLVLLPKPFTNAAFDAAMKVRAQ
ncbi:hypothetical protein BH11MYX1_BH11MYX1_41080 [soil metagenome]